MAVKPCRLFDTRNAGGAMTNASTRDFSVRGALVAQGGAANCGIPDGATAASINLTAISEGGTSGFVRGWAAGGSASTSTMVNFSPALNASNSVEVPLCEGACAKDVTLKMFGTAHLVGEVMGYFVPPIHGEIAPSGSVWRRSARVITAERVAIGKYAVTVDRSLINCSVSAHISSAGSGLISAYALNGKILAWTYDMNGNPRDSYWEFILAC